MALADIDRGITELLRKKAVAAGRLVDKTLYDPDDESAVVAFQAAETALRASLAAQGKFIVEVFGPGSWEDREAKSSCKIVVSRKGIDKGSIGSKNAVGFNKNLNEDEELVSYTKFKYPDTTYNVDYEVRIIAANVNEERTMMSWVSEIFDSVSTIKGVGDDYADLDDEYPIYFEGSVDMTGRDFIERIYRYEVRDVYLREVVVVSNNVPLLKQVVIKKGLWNPADGKYDAPDITTEVGDL